MGKFVKRLIAAGVASVMVVMPVMAAPSVEELEQQKSSLESQKAAAESQVDSLQSQLQDIISKINQLEEDLIAKGEEIEQAKKDLAAAERQEKKQYEDMKLRIKFMYEEGNSNIIEVLVASDNFADLINKAEYMQSVHTYDREKLEEYVETKEKVAALKTSLEEEQKAMEAKQQEYEAEEDNLDSLIASKQAEVADLDQKIQEAAAAAAAAAEKKRQEEEAARQAAAAASNNGGNGSAASGSSSGSKGSSKPAASYNSASGSTAVSRAYSKLGCPYVYGTAGPDTFDCSGLVSYCLTGSYSHVYTSGSLAGCPRVSDPQPGDVCVKPGHVGLYIGGGQMIHAPHTGDVVRISAVQSGMWYVRP